jgi:hypothetical protein
MEVVQRIGYDSFCPDNGVLIARNKDKESRNGGPNGFNCFNWVIDAHPEDINMVDYTRPDGKNVMRTIADYRQLNDALFHAGTNSGSSNEWTDEPNRLQFYILDLKKDNEGILSYKIAVRSLDEKTVKGAGCKISPSKRNKSQDYVKFTLKNTSKAGQNEVFRLSASTNSQGWKAQLLNNFIALKPGETAEVPVYVSSENGSADKAGLKLVVQPESNPGMKAECIKQVRR